MAEETFEEKYWKARRVAQSQIKFFLGEFVTFPKDKSGKLTIENMNLLFQEAQFDTETKDHIWFLADVDRDNKLGDNEFVLARYLIKVHLILCKSTRFYFQMHSIETISKNTRQKCWANLFQTLYHWHWHKVYLVMTLILQ